MVSGISTMADGMSSAGYQLGRRLGCTSMPYGPAAPSVFNATDQTSGPIICSYMTGWGSQGRESEETIVDRSTDLASGCFSFSSTS